jgi:AraC-like DNA-binding protein
MLLAGHKLASIAEALQFSDICHISRTFKQMEGVIPRVFLAGMRRGEGVERIDSIGDENDSRGACRTDEGGLCKRRVQGRVQGSGDPPACRRMGKRDETS